MKKSTSEIFKSSAVTLQLVKNDGFVYRRCGERQLVWLLQQDSVQMDGLRVQTYLQGKLYQRSAATL